MGVHQDGLVHVSQMSDHYVTNPLEVLSLHQHVEVKVLNVDHERNRIQLTMKDLQKKNKRKISGLLYGSFVFKIPR